VEVIRARHTDRQATLVVRGSLPTLDPHWTTRDVSLEELVLAYLTDDAAGTAHEAWGVAA
jgi:ABC-2 type transport system ATP-binding protein